MIEQFGMRRRFTAHAEVVHGAHKALAEKFLPHAIHGHTCGERIARIGDPVCELHAPAFGCGNRLRRVPRSHAQHAAFHEFAGRIRIAADRDVHVAGLLPIMHCEGLRHRGREELRVFHLAIDLLDARRQRIALLDQLGLRLALRSRDLRLQRGLFLFRSFAQGLQGLQLFRVLLFDPCALRLLLRGFGKRACIHAAPHAVVGLVGRVGAAENPGDPVVVLQADGIELVIVAARTAERHAEEGGAHFAHLLVHEIDLHLQLVHRHDLDIAQHEKAGRRDRCRALFRRAERQEVAGNLFADETVERLVRIERADDVVAIAPRMFREDVVRRADLIRIASQIEPVPRPALAECLRREQAIHMLRQ